MERIKNFFRTALFSMDVAVLFVVAIFAVNYWWIFSRWWVLLLFLVFPLLMRLNISIMLYRKRWPVASSLTVLILGACSFSSVWLRYLSGKMVRIALLLSGSVLDGISDRVYIDGCVREYAPAFEYVIFFWLWVLPLVVIVARLLLLLIAYSVMKLQSGKITLFALFDSTPTRGSLLLPDWKLSYLWQDEKGRLISFLLSVAVVAGYVGVEMSFLLSMVAVIVLPLLALLGVNRILGSKCGYKKVLLMLVGTILFWNAQFHTEFVRLAILLLSALSIGVACLRGGGIKDNRSLSVAVFMFVAFVLPTLALGYNQYTAFEVRRGAKYRVAVPLNGVMYAVADSGYGIRDRYGLLLPCEYKDITPCGDDYHYVCLEKPDNETVLYDLWEHEFVERKITINDDWQKKAESLIEDAIREQGFCFGQAVVMESGTGTLNVMASAGCSKSQGGRSYKNPWEYSFYTGLVRPFAYLAALNTGSLQLSDSVNIGNGVFVERGHIFRDSGSVGGFTGEITYAEGLRMHSNIAAYMLAKSAFGEDSEAMFAYLKRYGADKPVTIKDEYFRPLVNIEPKMKGECDAHLYSLVNGYTLELTALQVVNMYSLFADDDDRCESMKLYSSYKESKRFHWVSNTYCLDSLVYLLSSDNWPYFAEKGLKPDSVAISGYSDTAFQYNYEESLEKKSVSTAFCGCFNKDGKKYIIYVMLEKPEAPCGDGDLKCVVPELIDYIYNWNRHDN